MSDNCRWHKSLFFKNLSHFCEFRLELALWIKIPVKQATFSQSAFYLSAEASGPGIEGPAQAEQPAVRGTQDQDDLDPRSRQPPSDPPPLSDYQRTASARAQPSTRTALECPCFPHLRSGGCLDHRPRLQPLSRYAGLSAVDRAFDRRIILRSSRGR